MSAAILIAIFLGIVLLFAAIITLRALIYAGSDRCRVDDRLRTISGLTR